MTYQVIKSALKLCTGARKSSGEPCNGTLYTCKACGATGCKQSRDDLCSDQAFNVLEHCLKCGAIGQIEPVAAGDYRPQQAWLN
ncbi:hypothetical protein [Methylococcus mesophilus]|uniref:hypothetical protein n=1 Tax=Methylococcus mesophilus TaxID=2993564 RepID=UPI00224A5E6D|nr:hypothetical protein [Methylococcus mesophilus]UZR27304.1 hypothetical protein OOT43_11215 [Methylococcus mesophilus]